MEIRKFLGNSSKRSLIELTSIILMNTWIRSVQATQSRINWAGHWKQQPRSRRTWPRICQDVEWFFQDGSCLSYCWGFGTFNILKGHYDTARKYADFAEYFKQLLMSKSEAPIRWNEMYDLFYADLHTLVDFLRCHFPWPRLDAKYKEVKSITKVCFCFNDKCKTPGGKWNAANLCVVDVVYLLLIVLVSAKEPNGRNTKALAEQFICFRLYIASLEGSIVVTIY